MGKDTLTALEAGFLHLESPTTPMHIGSLAVFDGGPWHDARGRLRVQALRTHLSRRLQAVPRLRQRPVWPRGRLGRPVWVDDPDFDIARHVHARRLPPPVGEDTVLAAVTALHMELLDRAHPLWDLTFLDGLPGGRVALVERLHHALVDGIGGVHLAMKLMEPESAGPLPRQPEGRAAPPGTAASRLGPSLIGAAAHPRRTAATAVHLASAAASLAAQPLAPHSSLNVSVGAGRRYRVVRRSLGEVRRTGHALGGSVNDVVVAAVTGGLQELLAGRGESPSRDLHALVPVSLRTPDEQGDLGNRVAALIVALPLHETDPAARFAAARDAVRAAKRRHHAELAGALLDAAEYWPEPVVAAVSTWVHHQPLVNVVVTNVPGPSVPLTLMGARMLEVFPLVPLARNLTLSVGVLSYLDALTLGLWADAAQVPDLPVLVRGIEAGFDALASLAGTPAQALH